MDEPVGVAVIGVGSKWGKQIAAAALRSGQVKLISCFARSIEAREMFSAEFGAWAAGSLPEALSVKGVEGALVIAPAHVHLEITHACADQGLHVFVEKPMALRLEDALEMKEKCEKAGLILMVNHEMRHLGSSVAVRQVVQDGRLGNVMAGMAGFTFPGVISTSNWRGSRLTNRGGALMQLGIHHIDTLQHLFGEAVWVRGSFAHTAAPVDIDDVGIAELTLENGAVVAIVSTYLSPKAYELRLFGDQANLECVADMQVWPDALQVDARTRLRIQTTQGAEDIPIEPQDCLAVQLQDFAGSIRQKRAPQTGADQGIAALAAVEAALLSFESGKAVEPRSLYQI